MRKSLFKNLPLNATFTYRNVPLRKSSKVSAISLDESFILFIKPNTPVNYHKSKPLEVQQ